MRKNILAMGAFALFLSSCIKEPITPTDAVPILTTTEVQVATMSSKAGKTYYGSMVPMSHGFARTFVKINPQGKPIDVGVEFSEHALMGLQQDVMDNMDMTDHSGDVHGNVFELDFAPAVLGTLPFDHVSINWEEMGHPPFGIYDIPHFDVHFYMIPPSSQHMIMDDVMYAAPNMSPFEVVAPDFVPADYFPGPFVAEMGTHWISKNAPEFNGGNFTETFIYGTHNNQVIFFEPMVSMQTLLNKRMIRKTISQPKVYPQAGKYYAQNYSIYFNTSNRTHVVQLDNFIIPETN